MYKTTVWPQETYVINRTKKEQLEGPLQNNIFIRDYCMGSQIICNEED